MLPIFIETTINYARSILPWVALGVALAYYIERYIKPETIKKYVGEYTLRKSIFAIFLGMISPLSIMSFLPVARQFVDMGAHAGMLFTFLVAERAYDLQSFFILTSLFGFKFAILNALAIFISLFITAITLKGEKIQFKAKKHKEHKFWKTQLRLFGIIVFGIFLSSLLRVSIPQEEFQQVAGNTLGSLVWGLFSGLVIYLGPIIVNYPIAKAFLDLGMLPIGVFAFLTVSPVINIVIYLVFGAAVGYRIITKACIVYGVTSFILTLLFAPLL